MSIIPDVPPKLFTLSAVAVGYLLIDDTTAEEQNALGNWLMLVAQVLCTNGFYKQLQNTKNGNNQNNQTDTIIMMQKMMNAMQREINELKNKKDTK